jgi:hypothetical protein
MTGRGVVPLPHADWRARSKFRLFDCSACDLAGRFAPAPQCSRHASFASPTHLGQASPSAPVAPTVAVPVTSVPRLSYRTRHPLRVVGEVESWEGHAPEVLTEMLDHLALLREQGLDVIED